MLTRHLVIAAALLAAATTVHAQKGPRFEISFSKDAHAEPITGRVYVALSKTSDAQRGPIQQTGETGVPLYGLNVDNMAAGKSVVIDATTFGYPVKSLRDIPAGEYWVQPFVNIYTKFARADGPHGVAPHGPVGRPALAAVARQHLRASRSRSHSIPRHRHQ